MEMHFRKLKVWEKSFDLVKAVYELCKKLPKDEVYGLTSQIRRAAVSVPSNIAEGSQRSTEKDFANFLLIAKGSLAELETQLLLVRALGYCNSDDLKEILVHVEEIHRMLHSFYSKLVARSS